MGSFDPRNWNLLPSVVASASLLAGSCTTSEKNADTGGEEESGQECKKDLDCDYDELCVGGVCTPYNSGVDGAQPDTEPCMYASPCPTDEICFSSDCHEVERLEACPEHAPMVIPLAVGDEVLALVFADLDGDGDDEIIAVTPASFEVFDSADWTTPVSTARAQMSVPPQGVQSLDVASQQASNLVLATRGTTGTLGMLETWVPVGGLGLQVDPTGFPSSMTEKFDVGSFSIAPDALTADIPLATASHWVSTQASTPVWSELPAVEPAGGIDRIEFARLPLGGDDSARLAVVQPHRITFLDRQSASPLELFSEGRNFGWTEEHVEFFDIVDLGRTSQGARAPVLAVANFSDRAGRTYLLALDPDDGTSPSRYVELPVDATSVDGGDITGNDDLELVYLGGTTLGWVEGLGESDGGQACLSEMELPSAATSLAVGDVDTDGKDEIAVISGDTVLLVQ